MSAANLKIFDSLNDVYNADYAIREYSPDDYLLRFRHWDEIFIIQYSSNCPIEHVVVSGPGRPIVLDISPIDYVRKENINV